MHMNPDQLLDKLSSHLKHVVGNAITLASTLGHTSVAPIHMLSALLSEKGSIAHHILTKEGATPEYLDTYLSALGNEREHTDVPSKTETPTATLPNLSNISRSLLEKAMLLAYEYANTYVGTEHLLFAITQIDDNHIARSFAHWKIEIRTIESNVHTVIENTNHFPDIADMTDVMEDMNDALEGLPHMPPQGMKIPFQKNPQSRGSESRKQTPLDLFTTDLTHADIQSRIDPVIGREKEIERVINILGRRTKNNPILIGEPGVGKTAIVEGLAKRIFEGTVPDVLRKKKILTLDLTLLIAGTIYRGEFESRLKQIIDDVQARPDVILFIDEIHNIIGAGSNQGTMDAANILKPALARGQLRCIGATTLDEYKKYITSDPALQRRFQSVHVDEPSTAETLHILEGVKKQYEQFHHVHIPKKSLELAVELSTKYIHDNFLPDKAIDIIDEAAASVRAGQTDHPLMKKLDGIEKKLKECTRIKEQVILKEDYTVAMNVKKQEELLQKELDALKKDIADITPQQKKHVTKLHIARVVASRLHIDVDHILKDGMRRLADMQHVLSELILGQEHVIQDVGTALEQATLGIGSTKGPFASLLFAGPSGVGKTELAKQLAKQLYLSEDALIRLDMSEFAEQHGISKLLGSPAGYVGHKERNRFIDEIKKRPYAVVLFDEIDKAHPDVIRLLLQILDEGHITDSTGTRISFTHATIILTTNIGASLYRSSGIGFDDTIEVQRTRVEQAIHGQLKEHFGPELLGRLDTVSIFSPLTEAIIKRIIKKHTAHIANTMQEKNGMTLKLEKNALEQLVKDGYNEEMGARMVEKTVEKTLTTLLTNVMKEKKKKRMYTIHNNGTSYSLS